MGAVSWAFKEGSFNSKATEVTHDSMLSTPTESRGIMEVLGIKKKVLWLKEESGRIWGLENRKKKAEINAQG